MECSLVTVGLAFTPMGGALTDVRLAFGSLAPTPLRGRRTEAVLEGVQLSEQVIEAAVASAGEEVSPISDIRGGEAYRRAIAGALLRRLLKTNTAGRVDSS